VTERFSVIQTAEAVMPHLCILDLAFVPKSRLRRRASPPNKDYSSSATRACSAERDLFLYLEREFRAHVSISTKNLARNEPVFSAAQR
jgi:hypothetical protein